MQRLVSRLDLAGALGFCALRLLGEAFYAAIRTRSLNSERSRPASIVDPSGYPFLQSTSGMQNGKPAQKIVAQNFNSETVKLDNRHFIDCQFTDCIFVFEGSAPFRFKENQVSNCSWRFTGSAGLTVGILAQMYAGGFQHQVEELFDQIRGAGSD